MHVDRLKGRLHFEQNPRQLTVNNAVINLYLSYSGKKNSLAKWLFLVLYFY